MNEVEREVHTDGVILSVLLADDAQRPWSEEEVAREIEDRVAASDGLKRLARGGLVHRLNGFVFASRAALLAEEIKQ
ncbi:MAG: hypothetical protein WB698_06730 [Solirubrobacteraceae bacterium]